MQVTFPTGTKHFRLEDIYRYQEYPGVDRRWKERAFLFRDGSILWEMMGFSTYAEDGTFFSTGGLVHHNGAQHLPGRINGDYPVGISTTVDTIKEKGRKIFAPFSEVWEFTSE